MILRKVRMIALFSIVLLLLLSSFAAVSAASNGSEIILQSPNAQSNGEFGHSVAMTSAIAIVGAWGESSGGFSKAGNAYVFNASTGSLITSLTSPNPQTNGEFGISVAVSGTLVIVGASGEKVKTISGAGDAYVFNATNGLLINTLAAPDPSPNGFFGFSVAISSSKDIAVVGAYEQNGVGAAFVFNASTGKLITSLSSPNARTNGFFGLSVAISGDNALIGAPGEIVTYTDAGHAYLFNAMSGALLDTFASLNSQTDGFFGWSVSISGNLVVIGAPGEIANGNPSAGKTYLINTKTDSFTTLTSPNVQRDGEFGWSVSVLGKLALVGAPNETVGGDSSAGRSYLFNTNTGSLNTTLTSPNPQANQEYGTSVSLGIGDWFAVIGASGAVVDGFGSAGEAIITPQFPFGTVLAILAPLAAVSFYYISHKQKRQPNPSF